MSTKTQKQVIDQSTITRFQENINFFFKTRLNKVKRGNKLARYDCLRHAQFVLNEMIRDTIRECANKHKKITDDTELAWSIDFPMGMIDVKYNLEFTHPKFVWQAKQNIDKLVDSLDVLTIGV